MSGSKSLGEPQVPAPLPDVIQRLLPLTKQGEDYIWRPAREAIAEIERLRAKIEVDDMWRTFGWDAPSPQDADFADDLREFLSNQQDAEYFTDDPAPHPNEAMKLLVRLNGLFPEGDEAGEKAGVTQAAEGSEPSSGNDIKIHDPYAADPGAHCAPDDNDELLRLKSLNAELREGLDLLRGCIQEGGVPRYTAIPGAALNSIIEEVVDPLLSRTT